MLLGGKTGTYKKNATASKLHAPLRRSDTFTNQQRPFKNGFRSSLHSRKQLLITPLLLVFFSTASTCTSGKIISGELSIQRKIKSCLGGLLANQPTFLSLVSRDRYMPFRISRRVRPPHPTNPTPSTPARRITSLLVRRRSCGGVEMLCSFVCLLAIKKKLLLKTNLAMMHY